MLFFHAANYMFAYCLRCISMKISFHQKNEIILIKRFYKHWQRTQWTEQFNTFYPRENCYHAQSFRDRESFLWPLLYFWINIISEYHPSRDSIYFWKPYQRYINYHTAYVIYISEKGQLHLHEIVIYNGFPEMLSREKI